MVKLVTTLTCDSTRVTIDTCTIVIQYATSLASVVIRCYGYHSFDDFSKKHILNCHHDM